MSDERLFRDFVIACRLNLQEGWGPSAALPLQRTEIGGKRQ